MGMRLRQIRLDYVPGEDRLLLQLATAEATEIRLWLTRRVAKLLWPALVRLAEEASPRIRFQANPEARRALLQLEHEEAVARADFSQPLDEDPRALPLGETPALVVRLRAGRDRSDRPALVLEPESGPAVTLALDRVLVHAMCRLLQAAVKKSDWDLELRLPGSGAAAERGATRTLN